MPDPFDPASALRQAWGRDVVVERPLPGRGVAVMTAGDVRAARLSRAGWADGLVAERVEVRQPGTGWRPGTGTTMARVEATRLGGETPMAGPFRMEAREAVLRGAAGEVSAARVLIEGAGSADRDEGALSVEGGRLPPQGGAGQPDRFGGRTTWRMADLGLDLGMSLSFDGVASLQTSVALRDLPAAAFPAAGTPVSPERRLEAMLAFSEAMLASSSVEVSDLGGLPALLAGDGVGLRRWAET